MLLFVFKVGHSVQRRSKPLPKRTHHWRCYVDSWNPKYPLSPFVRKVTFRLHDTFENPRQVVHQPPFAIEEDGFGNFRLLIEVVFFDCVATFPYDLTLFDDGSLYTYRTVHVTPAPNVWDTMVQMGGIVIPYNSDSSDVHKVLQAIQSCGDLSTLNSYSFFPHLEKKLCQDRSSSSSSSTDSTNTKDLERCRSYASLPVQEHPKDRSSRPHDHFPRDTSSTDMAASLGRFSSHKPLLQKHKKKLQLLHEAQLLLENAEKHSSQWIAANPTEQFSSRHCDIPPLSPNIPLWPLRASPSRQPLCKYPTSEAYESSGLKQSSAASSLSGSIKSSSSEATQLESKSPVKRIVLKLSRCGEKNELTVASSSSQGRLADSGTRRLHRKRRTDEREPIRHRQEHMSSVKRDEPDFVHAAAVCSSTPSLESVSTRLPVSSTRYVPHCDTVPASDVSTAATTKRFEKRKQYGRSPPGRCLRNDASLHVPNPTCNDQSAAPVHSEESSSDSVSGPSDARNYSKPPLSYASRQCEGETSLPARSALLNSDDESLDSTDQIPPSSPAPHPLRPDSLNDYANHSHLLLRQADDDMHDSLSRTLFSQCDDSINADALSTDWFGDEDRDPSDSDAARSDVDLLPPPSPSIQTGDSRPLPHISASTSDDQHSSGVDERPLFSTSPVRAKQSGDIVTGHSSGSSLSTGTRPVCEVSAHISEPDCHTRSDLPKARKVADLSTLPTGEFHEPPSCHRSTMAHAQESSRDSSRPESTPKISACHASPHVDASLETRHHDRRRHRHHRRHPASGLEGTSARDPIPQSNLSESRTPLKPTGVEPVPNLDAQQVDHQSKGARHSASKHKSQQQIPAAVADKRSSASLDAAKKLETLKPSGKTSKNNRGSDSASSSSVTKEREGKQRSRINHLSVKTPSASATSSIEQPKTASYFKEQDIELSSLSSPHSDSSSSCSQPPQMSSNLPSMGASENTSKLVKLLPTEGASDRSASITPQKVVGSKTMKKTKSRPAKTPLTVQSSSLSPPPESKPTMTTCNDSRIDDVPAPASNSEISPDLHKYSNQQLELLLDRLLRLRQPHLAVRMSKILLHYMNSSPETTDPQAKAPGDQEKRLTKGSRGVKILNAQPPRVLAFNLRRLPIACLDQLSELIAEDEALDDAVVPGTSG